MPQSPLIFDRHLLRMRRARAAALGPSTFLIDRAAEDIAERLATVLRRFDLAVDLGTPTDAVRRVLTASGKVGAVIAADANLISLPRLRGRVGGGGIQRIAKPPPDEPRSSTSPASGGGED